MDKINVGDNNSIKYFSTSTSQTNNGLFNNMSVCLFRYINVYQLKN